MHDLIFPPSAPGPARPAGSWGLLPGRALSLHPRSRGRLALVQGRAWLTVSAAGQASTDMVLHAGEGVELPAHSHAVLEAWPQPVGAPALAWQWAALPVVAVAPLDWRQAVAVPARDLSLAGRALLEAAGRLGRGLLRLAASVLVRPWVASHAGRGVVWRIRWGLRSG
ncbi:MAG: DUF2917 domain-containing protein [Giesbergeria sp.]